MVPDAFVRGYTDEMLIKYLEIDFFKIKYQHMLLIIRCNSTFNINFYKRSIRTQIAPTQSYASTQAMTLTFVGNQKNRHKRIFKFTFKIENILSKSHYV